MTIAKLIREMVEKGVEPAIIEMTIATFEEAIPRNSADAQAEERRRRDRERKRLKAGIPQNSAESAEFQNVPLSIRKKEEVKEESKGEAQTDVLRKFRGSRLTDEWRPRVEDQTLALELLGHPGRVHTEILKFRDHWKAAAGSSAIKRDWDAAWRNWLRRASEFHGGQNGSSQTKPTSLIAAIDRRLTELEAEPDLALPAGPLFVLPGGSVR